MLFNPIPEIKENLYFSSILTCVPFCVILRFTSLISCAWLELNNITAQFYKMTNKQFWFKIRRIVSFHSKFTTLFFIASVLYSRSLLPNSGSAHCSAGSFPGWRAGPDKVTGEARMNHFAGWIPVFSNYRWCGVWAGPQSSPTRFLPTHLLNALCCRKDLWKEKNI